MESLIIPLILAIVFLAFVTSFVVISDRRTLIKIVNIPVITLPFVINFPPIPRLDIKKLIENGLFISKLRSVGYAQ